MRLLGDEGRGFLGEEDIAVDEIEHLDRDVFKPLATDQQDDGEIEAPFAHQVDQRRGLAFEALLAPVDHHAADRRVGLDRDRGVFELARLDDLEAGTLDLIDDLIEANALEIVGVECWHRKQEIEAFEIVHLCTDLVSQRCLAALRDNSVTEAALRYLSQKKAQRTCRAAEVPVARHPIAHLGL
jgi:hypothetical protein